MQRERRPLPAARFQQVGKATGTVGNATAVIEILQEEEKEKQEMFSAPSLSPSLPLSDPASLDHLALTFDRFMKTTAMPKS